MHLRPLLPFAGLLLPLLGTTPGSPGSPSIQEARQEGPEENDGDPPAKLGACILRQAIGTVPADPYAVGELFVESGHPLPKRLNACGILLAASDKVPDLFLQLVGEAVAEIFEPGDSIDHSAQREVLEHLHRYRACLPVPRTEAELERLFEGDSEELDEIMDLYSTCDIIMADVPRGQVMEVVEHLLHAITDVGLHYRFPAEWGISRESELWKAMQTAIEAGYYRIESYDDMRDEAPREVYERVLLQEFAYWFVSTAWNLQRDYGPDEDEWTIRDADELRRKLPGFYKIYERTAGSVMGPPSRALLAEIGPTREEERDG